MSEEPSVLYDGAVIADNYLCDFIAFTFGYDDEPFWTELVKRVGENGYDPLVEIAVLNLIKALRGDGGEINSEAT